MQFSPDLRDEVAAGTVTVSVRLWQRPQAKVGGLYPVAGAIIEVTSMELLPFSSITSADVRRSGESDLEALRTRAAHAGPISDDTPVYRIEFRVTEPPRRTGGASYRTSITDPDARRSARGAGRRGPYAINECFDADAFAVVSSGIEKHHRLAGA